MHPKHRTIRRLVLTCMVACLFACTSAWAGNPQKDVRFIDVSWVAPQSLDQIWDNADVVAKVSLNASLPVVERLGGEQVFTRFQATAVRVFKGDVLPGSALDFLQTGGIYESDERILKSDETCLLRLKRSYIVFLKTMPNLSAPLLAYNHYGAFEIVNSRVLPLAGGPVADSRRDMAENRFADELDRLRMTRGRPK